MTAVFAAIGGLIVGIIAGYFLACCMTVAGRGDDCAECKWRRAQE